MPIMSILPNGASYAEYAWAVPWMIGIAALTTIASFHTGTEISASRFGFLKWQVTLSLLYPAALLFVTGIGYFKPYLPKAVYDFCVLHNLCSLRAMLWAMTAFQTARVACSAIELYLRGRKK